MDRPNPIKALPIRRLTHVTRAGRRPSLIVRTFIQELIAKFWQHSHLVEAYKGSELLTNPGEIDLS
tara:strand:+ start:767 stop:964 length:198 start_codon:yes stop_codon:yes gene_type:complete